ncbi:transglutaminase-like domain-containing protein [Desulforhopalus singaporensis]|uniref:Transglutaminase-like enzyme, putative cysteine protease n=1 Tax=Desulforhopalus singaporensis TaxID=91360 RepID=A0A1H0QBC1_9BACT|nr:transglutaminase domain-containing protein [Desulforhopalus singaporensis]SDP14500.1 Transglutaminase-like enzyme, putative cysteine protease [Desulforhopalus singaporensis]
MKKIIVLLGFMVAVFSPFWCLAAVSESSGVITMEFDLTDHPVDKEMKLWIPYPLSDSDQIISDIRVEGDYAESAIYSDQKYSTPMLFARWEKGAASRKLALRFHVTRREVIKKDFPAAEGPWDPADYALYLAPTGLGPVDGAVKLLADQIVSGRTTVYAKAKAIYDWICENMYRDPDTRGCGTGDVCALIAAPGGKCTDIHSVFVSLCRAAGVPAREVFGIRQGKIDIQDITGWQHCWAEFYLPGYGWVPVDPADVRKMMLKENLTLDDEKTDQYREYFWGGWDAYRVKLAVGRDIVLNPPQKSRPLNTFGYPYAEADGAPLDWLDPKTFSYVFTYRK